VAGRAGHAGLGRSSPGGRLAELHPTRLISLLKDAAPWDYRTVTESSPPSSEPQWDDLGLVRRRGVRGWFRRHRGWTNVVVVVVYLLMALWGYPTAVADMGGPAQLLLIGHAVIAAALFLRHTRPFTVLVLVAMFEAAMLLHYPWQGAQMAGLCFAAYCMA